MTSLNSRFADLTVHYIPLGRTGFTLNEVALGFINAVKRQAIKDCEQHITSYTYTDTEYEDNSIRIRINAAAGAPEAQLIRCNFLYALKTFAIDILTHRRVNGARFTESYRGQLLYIGVLDNKNDARLLEQSTNASADHSDMIAQEKREPSTQSLDTTNSTIVLFTIPGTNDDEYQIEFDYRGNSIPRMGMFSSVLEFMMTLAQVDSSSPVENINQATSTDSVWIFVIPNQGSTASLKGFQLAAILESIARNAVNKRRYWEMSFTFLVNRVIVAKGCVTAPIQSRAWCQGLMEGVQQSLMGRVSSSSGVDLIQTQ